MNTRLLKAKDVSERLGISRSKAFGLMKDEQIPTVRFGRCVRVRPEDLERFIQTSLTVQTTNPLKDKLAVEAARMENKLANHHPKEFNHE